MLGEHLQLMTNWKQPLTHNLCMQMLWWSWKPIMLQWMLILKKIKLQLWCECDFWIEIIKAYGLKVWGRRWVYPRHLRLMPYTFWMTNDLLYQIANACTKHPVVQAKTLLEKISACRSIFKARKRFKVPLKILVWLEAANVASIWWF